MSKLDKVTMLFIVDLHNTPWVCTSADMSAIGCLHNLIRTNNSKRNFAGNFLSLCNRLFVFIIVGWRLEDMDVMVSNVGQNLGHFFEKTRLRLSNLLTRSLNSATSSSVRVSALAMMGMRLTFVCSLRMNSISSCLSLRSNAINTRNGSRNFANSSRMTSWLDKIQTSMNPVVNDFTPVDPVFLLKIRVEARFYVFYNGFPTQNAKSVK